MTNVTSCSNKRSTMSNKKELLLSLFLLISSFVMIEKNVGKIYFDDQ